MSASAIARARLCGVGENANIRPPVCRIVPTGPSGCTEEPSNRSLYADCTSDAPQFAVERPTENCLLRFEGVTEESAESVVTGPVCCNCGDQLEFIGMNGIIVEVENGAIKISKA